MSDLKYCQGPLCHTYDTKDRLKGTKDNKTFQTRRRSNFYYMGGNACSMRCQDDWFRKYGDRAVDHFGRLTEPKHLTKENAWYKDYDYNFRGGDDQYSNWRFVNKITNEQRPITEQQYNNKNYTLNKT
jgi:hypothetical protein|tara:strand:+ start:85 stop:468 length:384 start_codon:yes stop_codon:yes gene_type:complete